MVSDNLDPTPDVNCSPQDNSNLNPGTNAVTCTATDETGNSASCMFTVTLGKINSKIICQKIITI